MTEYSVHNQYPSTYDFHKDRERAKHLEDPVHRLRLVKAAKWIRSVDPASVSDLGCGDGGLLSLIKDIPSWGYDFTPSMVEGWKERGVRASLLDVFNDRHVPIWGDLVVMTEVLEHLSDPHGVLEWVAQNTNYLVASSPWGETLDPEKDGYEHDCHIWAWDFQGYHNLILKNFDIIRHEKIGWSQLVLAKTRKEV